MTNTSSLNPVPMLSPYHHIFFGRGFGFVPPPASRYNPSSPGLMLQYDQALFDNGTLDGYAAFGIGTQRPNPCFRFNLLSVNLGCNSTNFTCVFNVTGMQNHGWAWDDTPVVSGLYNVSACPMESNCSLTRVTFNPSEYFNMTSVSVQLMAGNSSSQSWWADDLQLGWTNSTCASGFCRSKVRSAVQRTKTSRDYWRRMIGKFDV
jgi:hypothetical protein